MGTKDDIIESIVEKLWLSNVEVNGMNIEHDDNNVPLQKQWYLVGTLLTNYPINVEAFRQTITMIRRSIKGVHTKMLGKTISCLSFFINLMQQESWRRNHRCLTITY